MSLAAFLSLRVPSMLAEMRANLLPRGADPYEWPSESAHTLPDPLTLSVFDGRDDRRLTPPRPLGT